MRYYLKTTIVVSLLLIITSCSRQEPEFVIGVSQCSQDIWREKQNAELRMGAYINGNVELRFTSANDNDERQVQQIDSLLGTGIDKPFHRPLTALLKEESLSLCSNEKPTQRNTPPSSVQTIMKWGIPWESL